MRKIPLLSTALCILFLSVFQFGSAHAEQQVTGGDMLYIDLVLFDDMNVLLPIPVLTTFNVDELKIKAIYDSNDTVVNFSPPPYPFSAEDIKRSGIGWFENVAWVSIDAQDAPFSVSRIVLMVNDHEYEYIPKKFKISIFDPKPNDQKIVPVSYPFNSPLDSLMETSYLLSSYVDMDITGIEFSSSQSISSVSINGKSYSASNYRHPVEAEETADVLISHIPDQNLSSFTYLSLFINYTIDGDKNVYQSLIPKLDLMVYNTQQRIEAVEKYVLENRK